MRQRIVQLLRQVLGRVVRRTPPRPGSVRRIGNNAEVFRNDAWEPIPRHHAADTGRGPRTDSPMLALRCPQAACTDRAAIGRVWPQTDDGRGLWAADSPHQPAPSLHRRAIDAARWVRSQHDARDHATTRWTSDHLDTGSAADTAAARTLTRGSAGHRSNPEDPRT